MIYLVPLSVHWLLFLQPVQTFSLRSEDKLRKNGSSQGRFDVEG